MLGLGGSQRRCAAVDRTGEGTIHLRCGERGVVGGSVGAGMLRDRVDTAGNITHRGVRERQQQQFRFAFSLLKSLYCCLGQQPCMHSTTSEW